MGCIESVGVQIVVPSQTIFLSAGSITAEAGVNVSIKARAPVERTNDQAAKICVREKDFWFEIQNLQNTQSHKTR